MIIIYGKPLILWLGLVLLILLTFQILTGARIIKVPFNYHRKNGYLLGLIAVIHALVGIRLWF